VCQINLCGFDRIFELNDVLLAGKSGICIHNNSVIWEQAKFPLNCNALYPHDSILKSHTEDYVIISDVRRAKKKRKYKYALSLLDSFSTHFGHFAIGAVPKLRVLDAGLNIDELVVLLDKEVPKHFLELVLHFFPAANISLISPGEVVAVERLLIPEGLKWFPDHYPGVKQQTGPERALKIPEFSFIFDMQFTPEKTNVEQKVRLLRHNNMENNWRKLQNSDEIDEVLKLHGFAASEHLLVEHARLHSFLRNATHIVTDDGSISFNLLLAGVKGKKIIVLAHPGMGGFQEWFVPGVLAVFGNQVTVVKGTSEDSESKFSDWRIDSNLLNRLLGSHQL
jgi:capsular polysaccharide biosynthesis protein